MEANIDAVQPSLLLRLKEARQGVHGSEKRVVLCVKAITEYGLRQQWRESTHLLAARTLSSIAKNSRSRSTAVFVRRGHKRRKRVPRPSAAWRENQTQRTQHTSFGPWSDCKALQKGSQCMSRSWSVGSLRAHASQPWPTTTSRRRPGFAASPIKKGWSRPVSMSSCGLFRNVRLHVALLVASGIVTGFIRSAKIWERETEPCSMLMRSYSVSESVIEQAQELSSVLFGVGWRKIACGEQSSKREACKPTSCEAQRLLVGPNTSDP